MTFGAMAAWQAWILLAGAGAVAAWIFLIKIRPPRTFVPSLLLWRRVLDESREETLWERIRRAVSLAVTVAIALMLAFAAADPARRTNTDSSAGAGRRLLVLDSSLSMLARTSSGETRWARAVAQAKRLSGAWGGEVALATTADGLVEGPTSDRSLIDAALDRTTPDGADATHWPGAMGASDIHFMTDGAVARALEPGVVIHSVFERADNVAVTAFAVRPSFAAERPADAYLEVANYAASAQRVRIVLTRGAMPMMDRTVDMSAGESLRQVIPIARGATDTLRARVEARRNALDVDDDAFAWVDRAQPLSVAVVGDDAAWLASLLERDPTVRPSTVASTSYPNGTGRAGVIIFDRWAPASASERPALYIAPPRDTPWLAPSPGARAPNEEQRPRWEDAGSHPVVRGVDPFTLTIDRARAYAAPDFVPVSRSARGTPLVYVAESPDRRAVIVTFGPGESNLSTAPAFPVLIGNAIEWLAAPFGHTSQAPGLAPVDVSVSSVTEPGGGSVPLVRVDDVKLGMLRRPGLYAVHGAGGRGTIAVNAGDARLSDLTRTMLTSQTPAHTVQPGGPTRPWWVYAVTAAFALALLEWWTWQRRITV